MTPSPKIFTLYTVKRSALARPLPTITLLSRTTNRSCTIPKKGICFPFTTSSTTFKNIIPTRSSRVHTTTTRTGAPLEIDLTLLGDSERLKTRVFFTFKKHPRIMSILKAATILSLMSCPLNTLTAIMASSPPNVQNIGRT